MTSLLSTILRALAIAVPAFFFSSSACAEIPQTPQELYLDALRSIAEGRQADASDALLRMIEQEPEHAGAWLDLAIIQCELGRATEAERLFKTIESRFSPPPVILEVIAKHRAQGCHEWHPKSRASVVLGRGIDGNVNQGASNPNFSIGTGDMQIDLQLLPNQLPQNDQYSLLSSDYERDLTSNGGMGFLQFRGIANDKLTSYNTFSGVAGLEQPLKIGNWDIRGSGLIALHGLGGKLYQVQSQTQIRVTPPLKLPDGLQFSVNAGLSHTGYKTPENFDANTAELRCLLAYRKNSTQGYASLGYLFDRGSTGRPGGDRQGWAAGLQTRAQVTANIIGEFNWTYQSWLGQFAYSPGLINQTRDQKTSILRGALIFPVAMGQSIQIEARHVKNKENISVFEYSESQLQISWQYQVF